MAIEDSATVLTNPAPLSSVQIEQAAKGPPRCTVKVYAASVEEAAQIATDIYDRLVARYRDDIPA